MYRYLQKCLYRGLCPKLNTNLMYMSLPVTLTYSDIVFLHINENLYFLQHFSFNVLWRILKSLLLGNGSWYVICIIVFYSVFHLGLYISKYKKKRVYKYRNIILFIFCFCLFIFWKITGALLQILLDILIRSRGCSKNKTKLECCNIISNNNYAGKLDSACFIYISCCRLVPFSCNK